MAFMDKLWAHATQLPIWAVLFIGTTVLFVLHRSLFTSPAYPAGLPLVAEPPGRTWFSPRTRWRYYTDCASLYSEAYTKYSKHGKPVVVPGFGLGYEVIMPGSMISWLLAQPDSAISVNEAFLDISKTGYSLGHRRYWGDTWQFDLVKTQLNSVLQYLIPGLDEELKLAIDVNLGSSTETWKEIELEKVLRNIVSQAAGRFTVGAPLCRSKKYLDANCAIINGMMLNAVFTNSSPKWLQPLVGRLICWNTHRKIATVKKEFAPLYRERLGTLKYDKNDPSHTEPQDHLQLILRFADKERRHELHNLDIIAKRLIAVNFASINQTTLTVTNMILNILGSDAEFDTIRSLRDEMKQVHFNDGTPWSKAKLAKMIRTDSVVRETLRFNPFGNRSLMRKVIKDGGVVTPDGMTLRKGLLFSFFAEPVQHDPDNFKDPHKYDPFRTSREHEATAAGANGNKGGHIPTLVSTSTTFLPWGHGKHACPGRFLVDAELKILLTYLFLNYDLELPSRYGGQRPPNVGMAEVGLPPPGVKIRVKRCS